MISCPACDTMLPNSPLDHSCKHQVGKYVVFYCLAMDGVSPQFTSVFIPDWPHGTCVMFFKYKWVVFASEEQIEKMMVLA